MQLKDYTKLLSFVLTSGIFACFSISVQGQNNNMRPAIQKIAAKLKKGGTFHLGFPAGYSGQPETKNSYYKLYKKLARKASDKEIVLLVGDSSKTIVLYSFLILYNRQYSGLKQIFLKHINDTSIVAIAAGCTGLITKVNTFMLGQLNPASSDSRQPYLKQNEFDLYVKDIGGSQ